MSDGNRKNIVLITGASSGMGREFVKQLTQSFVDVEEFWLVARDLKKLRKVAKKIPQETIRLFAIDLTKDCERNILQNRLEEEKPRIKMVVNAAGYGIMGDFTETTMKESLGMIELNCMSLTALTYMVLPYMGRKSYLLQMASASAFMPQTGFAVYAATKSYVLQFSRALAYELRNYDITVTTVCPGAVRTAFLKRAQKYHKVKLYKKLVMAKPEKVVEKALKDAKKGKQVSIYGIMMQLFWGITKIFPHSFLLNICSILNGGKRNAR